MIQKVVHPERSSWIPLSERPSKPIKELEELVFQIFGEIEKRGDKAIKKYTSFFDGVDVEDFVTSASEMEHSERQISEELKEAIQLAKHNIETFHRTQIEEKCPVETNKGVLCWRENRPIENVGIYIPGGSAPLFSTVLMLGIPAKLAGCKEIILCTPPNKQGVIDSTILYTAKLIGIHKVYSIGGIQAIGAMTLGTRSIPKVSKIFGPGNQYVTAAKQVALSYGIAIDMPAGPSEVLIIADKTSNPEFVAADLLAQAEHGVDSQVILLSNDEKTIDRSIKALYKQLDNLPRVQIARKALENSKAILFENISTCIEFSNYYAPEHLIIASENASSYVDSIINAGAVFLGNYSCESAGDYASGTNHTLPTNGYATCYSGVSLDSFVKKITFQELSEEGLRNIGPAIEIMAEAEKLYAHKNAVSLRLKPKKSVLFRKSSTS